MNVLINYYDERWGADEEIENIMFSASQFAIDGLIEDNDLTFINFICVNDESIRIVNKEFLNQDKVTDVSVLPMVKDYTEIFDVIDRELRTDSDEDDEVTSEDLRKMFNMDYDYEGNSLDDEGGNRDDEDGDWNDEDGNWDDEDDDCDVAEYSCGDDECKCGCDDECGCCDDEEVDQSVWFREDEEMKENSFGCVVFSYDSIEREAKKNKISFKDQLLKSLIRGVYDISGCSDKKDLKDLEKEVIKVMQKK